LYGRVRDGFYGCFSIPYLAELQELAYRVYARVGTTVFYCPEDFNADVKIQYLPLSYIENKSLKGKVQFENSSNATVEKSVNAFGITISECTEPVNDMIIQKGFKTATTVDTLDTPEIITVTPMKTEVGVE